MKWLHLFFLFSFSVLWSHSFEDLGEGIFIQRNHDSSINKKKIAIVTVIISGKQQDSNRYTGFVYKDIVAFGTRSKELYAKKHGYDLIMGTEKIDNCYGIQQTRDLESSWTKLAVISRILDDYDWVFWSDADSIILDFNVQLESFLNEDFDMIACAQFVKLPEPQPWGKKIYKDGKVIILNAGQVFYKNCDFCKEVILNAWNNHHEYTPGKFEQRRINAYLREIPDSEEHVLAYDLKAFNIHAKRYKKGDFLVHMYGWHGDKLEQSFKEFENNYSWILDQEEEYLNEKEKNNA